MKLRKALALLLGLLLVLTPLAALAEGEDTDEPVNIGIDENTPAEERTQERNVGNITLTGDINAPAAEVQVNAEGQGTLRAKDVTAVQTEEGGDITGVQVSAAALGAQATVAAGDIAATADSFATGVSFKAADGGTVAVTAGAITATGYSSSGVSATATQGGATTVNVTGADGVQTTGDYSYGMDLLADGTDAAILAQVTGDIVVQGDSRATGAYVLAYTGGETELVCGGSVFAEGNRAVGLEVSAMESGAQAAVAVAGDVKATGDGAIGLRVWAVDTGVADVLVAGTISGETAVEVSGAGTEEAAALTVWALEGNITSTREGDAEAFAKKIRYILKADPIPGGDVALDGATKYKGYDVATAGTTVTVLPTLAEGCILLGVSNNGTALAKDGAGNFFLVVPQGGGVYLTFDVEGAVAGYPPIPVRCLGKVTSDDAALKFYDCGTFEIIRNGQGTVGFYAFEDGHLALRCVAPVSLAENADGSATLSLGDLAFAVESSVIENLK